MENYLSNPKVTIDVLQRHQFRFKKNFGQNFLIDDHVIGKIIRAAGITKESRVLEIGPGIGTLTQHLSDAAGQVVAVEIDGNLIPILEETLAGRDNIRVVHQDILKCDIPALMGDGPFSVVANLPYYITTPIIMQLLESGIPAESITVMVQKEVADRMAAAPGTKDYGALSLAVQYYAEPYLAANVPPNCFMPRPNVGSAVVRLDRRTEKKVSVQDEKLLFRLIRASFGQRRKTLVNALSHGAELPKDMIREVLPEQGLSETVRGETLSLEQFGALADAFSARGIV